MADWRLEVLLEPERTGRTVTEVCSTHGISRDTFYRWKKRFEAAGVAGLLERSTAPLSQPKRISPEMEKLICDLRRAHPRWGARTISGRLRREGVIPPARSTIHRALKRNGLVVPSPRKRPHVLIKRFERPEPNDLWQMDDTEVKLTRGRKVKVLSIIDDHARFLLTSVVCREVTSQVAWQAFTAAARRYGLPRQLLSDNAVALTGRLRGHEVAFERQVRATGVSYIQGRPYHPQTQGKIERFHQTLCGWIEDEGGAASAGELRDLLERFKDDYNNHRPHQSLHDATPAERFTPTDGLFQDVLRSQRRGQSPPYPPGSIVRKADRTGTIGFEMLLIALGKEWAYRKVRIEPDGPRLRILYGDHVVRDFVPDRSRRRQRLPRRSRAS